MYFVNYLCQNCEFRCKGVNLDVENGMIMSGYNISISYRESTWCLYYCVVMTQKLGTQMVPGKLVNRCLFPKIKYANNGFWPMPIWFHLLYWDITDITMNNRGYDHEHCYCYYRDCIWCLCMPLCLSPNNHHLSNDHFQCLKPPFFYGHGSFHVVGHPCHFIEIFTKVLE